MVGGLGEYSGRTPGERERLSPLVFSSLWTPAMSTIEGKITEKKHI